MNLNSLKEIDVQKFLATARNLDPERMGSWPLVFRMGVWVFIALFVVAGGWEFFVSDNLTQLSQARQQEVSKKNDFESKAFKAANLNLYRKQLADMELTFGTLLKQLPKEAEVPGLLEDISQTGLGSGLDFDSITLLPEVRKQFYAEDPIDVRVRGDYHAFGSFVSGIAALPRIVTLHDFRITPVDAARAPGDNTPPLLYMQITAKTYRYLDVDHSKNDQGGKH